MPASKTIYVDVDGKKVIVIGDPSKFKIKSKLGKKQKEGDLDPSDMPENLQQEKPEPTPQKPTVKGIRKALRGGGRAYGKNS
jgi:hypothetical protein